MFPQLPVTRQAGFVAMAALLSSATLSAALLPALRPAADSRPVVHGTVIVLPRVVIIVRPGAEATLAGKRTALSV